MRVLELFSGTGSVGRVCHEKGYDVISLDINGKADITCDILHWNYSEYPNTFFDIIWASPDCTHYSKAKTRGVRNLRYANSLVLKTLEIISYFNPRYWYIENPQTGLLKKQPFMKNIPFIDADYCMYGFTYRKSTRFWTNVKAELKLCNKECGSFVNGRHLGSCGNFNKKICKLGRISKEQKYRIPSKLLHQLIV